MKSESSLSALFPAGLAHRCRQETDRYYHRLPYDEQYCFELFRRAILHRDQSAWEYIYAQYGPQVTRWARRHPAFSSTGEEAQYFVNRAFEKMWLALNPDRFGRFPNLKSLLRYLQMCVHSTILDVVRAKECPVADTPIETLAVGDRSNEPAVEGAALDRVQRQELWREIETRLRSDQERRVVYGSFVLALKPSELHDRYPDTFRDVKHVYRVKENVLARLSRDNTLRALFGQDI